MVKGVIPRCDICRERDAEFVCRRCGRLCCRYDFSSINGVCRICLEEMERYEGYEKIIVGPSMTNLFPWALIFIGFIIIFIGFILMSFGSIPTQLVNQSYVIIWPLPVIFTGNFGLIIGLLYLILIIAIFIWIMRKFFKFV